ncbi:hypothetical protein B0H13DRAFT_1884072 [Mycena leptocephala]|nr:hypothetical protein B0H13DRAFT_1884072 [Mycena leptocephala]
MYGESSRPLNVCLVLDPNMIARRTDLEFSPTEGYVEFNAHDRACTETPSDALHTYIRTHQHTYDLHRMLCTHIFITCFTSSAKEVHIHPRAIRSTSPSRAAVGHEYGPDMSKNVLKSSGGQDSDSRARGGKEAKHPNVEAVRSSKCESRRKHKTRLRFALEERPDRRQGEVREKWGKIASTTDRKFCLLISRWETTWPAGLISIFGLRHRTQLLLRRTAFCQERLQGSAGCNCLKIGPEGASLIRYHHHLPLSHGDFCWSQRDKARLVVVDGSGSGLVPGVAPKGDPHTCVAYELHRK